MIRFNVPPYVGKETEYMKAAIDSHKICGDGEFTKRCNAWIEEHTGTAKALLTTSGTQALEMAALLSDIQPGDEVILMGSDGTNTILADDIGKATGTINYEIVCAFGQRLPKVYTR